MKFIDYLNSISLFGPELPAPDLFDGVFWMLIGFNILVLAYVRTASPGYIAVLFKTAIYNRQIYQNIQEDLRLNSTSSVFLTLAYFNCAALITACWIKNGTTWLPLLMLAVLLGVFILKFLVVRSVRILTQTDEGVTEHWLNHLIYFQTAAIMITPVLAFIHFTDPEFRWIVCQILTLVVLFLVFYRDFQSLMRALRQRVPLVYIILYLCTLELLPLIVLIRVLVR